MGACGHSLLMPRRAVLSCKQVKPNRWHYVLKLDCGHVVERKTPAFHHTRCEKCHAEAKAPCSANCHITCISHVQKTTCHGPQFFEKMQWKFDRSDFALRLRGPTRTAKRP